MAEDVRGTFSALPGFTQPFLTWLTGKALPGQKEIFKHNPWTQTVLAFLELAAGAAGALLLLRLSGFWLALLPIAWTLTVGAARKIQITICHGCVHSAFTGSKKWDQWIIEILSTLLMIQDYHGYRRDHRETHHGKDLATLDDPDVQFMLDLGLRPGRTRSQLWTRLFLNCISPKYHVVFLYYRLKSNFWSCPRYRKIMSIVFQASVLSAVAWTGVWLEFLVAWVVPIFFIYHISAILQFTCEHYWLRVRQPGETSKIYLARLTTGRFMGEPAPPPGLPLHQAAFRWSWWAFKMLTYHLFCRVFVVVGDMPAHDWHHRYPFSRDWANALYARQRDIDQGGTPQWKEPYTETWGMHNILGAVFQMFSTLPPVEKGHARQMSLQEMEEVMRTM